MGFFDSLKSAAEMAKTIGGAGLDLAGAAAKSVGSAAADAVSDGLGLNDSTRNTVLEYKSDMTSDLRYDDEYQELFKTAISEIAKSNPKDNYINALLEFNGAGEVTWKADFFSATVLAVPEDRKASRHVIAWQLKFNRHGAENGRRTVTLKLETPTAKQLQWDEKKLVKGYEISSPGEHLSPRVVEQKQRDEESRAQDEELRERKRKEDWKDSFFGIKFGAGYRDYAIESKPNERQSNDNTSFYEVMCDEPLMEFDQYFVGVKPGEETVSAIRCIVDGDVLDDPDEFFERIKAYLIKEFSAWDCMRNIANEKPNFNMRVDSLFGPTIQLLLQSDDPYGYVNLTLWYENR